MAFDTDMTPIANSGLTVSLAETKKLEAKVDELTNRVSTLEERVMELLRDLDNRLG